MDSGEPCLYILLHDALHRRKHNAVNIVDYWLAAYDWISRESFLQGTTGPLYRFVHNEGLVEKEHFFH